MNAQDREPFFPLSPWARENLEAVRQHLIASLPEPLQPHLEDLAFEIPGLEPYPFRPYLLLMAARSLGCSGDRPVRLAASIQMIHVASVLHDRLGGPVPSRPDAGEAVRLQHQRQSLDILLGDFFFSRASAIIVEDGDRRIIEDMIETSLASAEAKARVVTLDAERGEAGPGRCFEVVSEKTSLLLSLSLRVGAVLGGAEEAGERSFSEFGTVLGRALRIAEDLAFWNRTPVEARGLPSEMRYSHPLLVLWEAEGEASWRRAWEGIERPEGEPFEALRSHLRDRGYLETSLHSARGVAEEAVVRLAGLADGEEVSSLRDVARVHLLRAAEAGS